MRSNSEYTSGISPFLQLLATALGARVSKGAKKEIGWYPIRLRPDAAGDKLFGDAPASFTAYHWHGDIFDLPNGSCAACFIRADRAPGPDPLLPGPGGAVYES